VLYPLLFLLLCGVVVPHWTRTALTPTLRCGGACRTLKEGSHGFLEGAPPQTYTAGGREGGGGDGGAGDEEVVISGRKMLSMLRLILLFLLLCGRCCTSPDPHCTCADTPLWRSLPHSEEGPPRLPRGCVAPTCTASGRGRRRRRPSGLVAERVRAGDGGGCWRVSSSSTALLYLAGPTLRLCRSSNVEEPHCA
jgi:hypothetical protein